MFYYYVLYCTVLRNFYVNNVHCSVLKPTVYMNAYVCTKVVLFYNWAISRQNLTMIEGWKRGDGYFCDDTQNNR